MSLIGLTGHMGAGKDEVAKILVQSGFVRIAFADPLKSLARVLGWDGSKEDLGPCPCCGMLRGRQFLQVLGTEGVRQHIDEAAWLKLAWREIQRHEQVVVTDVRFQNEADFIRTHGGEVWRVQRPGWGGDSHSSEMEQEDITTNQVILNDEDLAVLAERVQGALLQWK